MIKTRFFAIVIGVCPFVNGMMSCLVTSEPRPVPTPVGLAVPSLNPDLSVIMCVPIEQSLTESIRALAEDSFKKIARPGLKPARFEPGCLPGQTARAPHSQPRRPCQLSE